VRDRAICVLDVGKTHAKLTLWAPRGGLVARRTRPNESIDSGTYRALDARRIEAWAVATLAEFATLDRIGTIIPVGHGAAAAFLRQGTLAAPPFDYEQPIPPAVRSRYDVHRDTFARTGSPPLPDGLNLGAQLFWLEQLVPALRDPDVTIVPWAQYWSWVLCGVAASELTSLGCHTDLWCPALGQPSALAVAMGWDRRLAPLRRANDVLGTLRPDWVRRTGLAADTQVLCGLHDSNSALLAARGFAEIEEDEATVISTGTWFVAMRSPGAGELPPLPEHRDCLWNVDAFGKLIPSARFMGGRELELLTTPDDARVDDPSTQAPMMAAVAELIHTGAMVLPTLAPGCGPFPRAAHRWHARPAERVARLAASCVYAALVMDSALALIDARGSVLIEGRFADAQLFVRALASLRPGAAVYTSHAHNGVPFGALRLVEPDLTPVDSLRRVKPLSVDLSAYATEWRRKAGELGQAA
jgi:sugar (pentulose or hexulose) kinase